MPTSDRKTNRISVFILRVEARKQQVVSIKVLWNELTRREHKRDSLAYLLKENGDSREFAHLSALKVLVLFGNTMKIPASFQDYAHTFPHISNLHK